MKTSSLLFLILAAAILCGIPALAPAAESSAQLEAQAKASGDKDLVAIASELTGKLESLGSTLTADPEVKSKLDSVLKSITGGKDSDALASAYKLAADAKLTPEQLGIAKEVGNLASAYVVQKDFSSLEGSQSDVATVVKSLRQGELTKAVPALQNIGKNANLTSSQKDLLKTLADNYAPGLNKAADSLKKVKIPGF